LEKYGATSAARKELDIAKAFAEAARSGQCEIVELFLEKYGAALETRKELDIARAFAAAVNQGERKIAELFFEKYGATSAARKELDIAKAFAEAARSGHRKTVELLLEKYGATFAARKELNIASAFEVAVSRSHFAIVEFFLNIYGEEIIEKLGVEEVVNRICRAIRVFWSNDAAKDFGKTIITICLDICIKHGNDSLLKYVVEAFNQPDVLSKDILQALQEPMKQAQEDFNVHTKLTQQVKEKVAAQANLRSSIQEYKQTITSKSNLVEKLTKQVNETAANFVKCTEAPKIPFINVFHQELNKIVPGVNQIISVSNAQQLEAVLDKIQAFPTSDTAGGTNTITIILKPPFESVDDNSKVSLVVKINNGQIAIESINAPMVVKDIIKEVLGAQTNITGTFVGSLKQDIDTKKSSM
jgi:hypothetical protein